MADKFIVRTIDEYVTLPELEIPTISGKEMRGRIFYVYKVGFYLATIEECRVHGLEALALPKSEHYVLPTIVVAVGNEKRFYRLPCSLASWVGYALKIAHEVANPFPRDVELGVVQGGFGAEIVSRTMSLPM